MTRRFKEYAALAFGQRAGGGNPAAVFVSTEDGLDRARAQAVAAERALPVCVFLRLGASRASARFFTPREELALCAHGILPAGALALSALGADATTTEIETASGIVRLSREGDLVSLDTEHHASFASVPDTLEVLACFGLSEQEVDDALPFGVGSIGSPKCLIPVRRELSELAYDPARLERWSRAHGVNGAYVYRAVPSDPLGRFDARAFNPKTGSPEDAATGVAAGALVGVLPVDFRGGDWVHITQGVAMGRPCELLARRSRSGVEVGGKVECIERGEHVWS